MLDDEHLIDSQGNLILNAVVRLKCPLCGQFGDLHVEDGTFMCYSCARTGTVDQLADGEKVWTTRHPMGQPVKLIMADEATLKELQCLSVPLLLNRLSAARARDMVDEQFIESTLRGAEDAEIGRLLAEASQAEGREGMATDEVIRLLNDFRDRPDIVKVNPVKQRTPEEHVALFGEGPSYSNQDPATKKKLTLDQLAELAGEDDED
jgi:hypothetical protein